MTGAEFNKQAQFLFGAMFSTFNELSTIASEVGKAITPLAKGFGQVLATLQDDKVAENFRFLLYFLKYLAEDPFVCSIEELITDLESRGLVEVVRQKSGNCIMINRRNFVPVDISEFNDLLRFSQVRKILLDVDVY